VVVALVVKAIAAAVLMVVEVEVIVKKTPLQLRQEVQLLM
jgi:hypothetical protein